MRHVFIPSSIEPRHNKACFLYLDNKARKAPTVLHVSTALDSLTDILATSQVPEYIYIGLFS